MKILYIAHRLFSLHDRLLASNLAQVLQQGEHIYEIFLPYCDTNEQNVIVHQKGKYLFERDMERLSSLALLIALLHGPGYDDGVCLEIGYAYGYQTPLLLITTDFLSYSFRDEQRQFLFSDPLFEFLHASVVRVCEPAPLTSNSRTHRYQAFGQSHEQALQEMFSFVQGKVHQIIRQGSNGKKGVTHLLKQVYIDPSPSFAASDLTLLQSHIERIGWTCYIARRFQRTIRSTEEEASRDLQEAQQSSLFLLDGNGPEVPAGAAFFAGLGLAMHIPTILYYTGTQTTHAPGREENPRNLMLLYGCTTLASSYKQAEELCLSYCLQHAAAPQKER